MIHGDRRRRAHGRSGERIAVIIPARNEAPHILGALESLDAQNRLPDEVVVVDDGSTDETVRIVEAWAERTCLDHRVLGGRYGSAAAARNRGIRASECELIALLDADDRLLPHHLLLLEQGIAAAPDAVLSFGNAEKQVVGGGLLGLYFTSETQLDGVERRPVSPDHQFLRGSAYLTLLRGSYIPTCGTLFRRDAALRVGLFDESLRTAEDRDLWLRLSRAGNFVCTSHVVARVRYHERNTSATNPGSALARNRFRVLWKMLHGSQEWGLSTKEQRATEGALLDQASNLLYAASLEGPMILARCAGFLWRHGVRRPCLNPAHLFRCMAFRRDLEPNRVAPTLSCERE